ncbi:hypothetical protein JOM56_002340 [Amanita muscaria]
MLSSLAVLLLVQMVQSKFIVPLPLMDISLDKHRGRTTAAWSNVRGTRLLCKCVLGRVSLSLICMYALLLCARNQVSCSYAS